MKKFTLTFSLFCAIGALAFAGETYSGKDKEVMQTAPPPCDWYRAHEWDFDFWGTFSFVANGDQIDRHKFFDDNRSRGGDLPSRVDIGPALQDRLQGRENNWGGGLDVKYFWNKHWAAGLEGMGIAAKTNFLGGGFGTITFRWPIGCSRFAPYLWAGPGVFGGGGKLDYTFTERESGIHNRTGERHFISTDMYQNKHAKAAGQFGAGIECRITRHVGVMTDFAWNTVSGPDNDFGTWRFGATLSY